MPSTVKGKNLLIHREDIAFPYPIFFCVYCVHSVHCMVPQNTLRTYTENSRLKKNVKLITVVDLKKCLNDINIFAIAIYKAILYYFR